MITNDNSSKIKVPDYLLEPMQDYVKAAVKKLYASTPDFILLESLFKKCIYEGQEINNDKVDRDTFSNLKKMYQNPGEFFKCGTQIAEDVQNKYQKKMKKALKIALNVQFEVQQTVKPAVSDEAKNALIEEQRKIMEDRFVVPPCRQPVQFPPYPIEKSTFCLESNPLFRWENLENEHIALKGISGSLFEVDIFTKVMKIEFVFQRDNIANQFELEMKKIGIEVTNRYNYTVSLKFEDLNHFLQFIKYFKNNNVWLGNLSEFEILCEIISHKFQKLDQNKSLHDVKFPLRQATYQSVWMQFALRILLLQNH